MSETYSVYNKNGTLANELAQCRVIKISSGVYTWDIVGGSAASTSEESIVADDNYSVICAEISGAERAGVPIEWAVNSAKDFYIVAVCGGGIIDGVSDGAFSYDAIKKVLWLECPFENAETWQAYIFRSEKPVNNFAIAEGRARISAIQAQFEKDNRVMRQIIAERFRTLRTPDTTKTLPPKEIRAGKVLAFDGDGNPDLSLSKEEVEGAYLARDEAKELKNKTETLKNETAELKSDAESYKNYAIDAAAKAVLAQGKTEEALNKIADFGGSQINIDTTPSVNAFDAEETQSAEKLIFVNSDPNMGASVSGGYTGVGKTSGAWVSSDGSGYGTKYIANADLTNDTESASLGIEYAIDYTTYYTIAVEATSGALRINYFDLKEYGGQTVKIKISFYAKKISDDTNPITIWTNGLTTSNRVVIKNFARSLFNFETWTKVEEVVDFTVIGSGLSKPIAVGCMGGDTGSYRIANFNLSIVKEAEYSVPKNTSWTDGEFKILDADGNLIYWVSTQWGAQMGGEYESNPATDLNAKIFYTSPENENNGAGKGREWIEYVHNNTNARTIYEHAQTITGSATPTIGGIIIQPDWSNGDVQSAFKNGKSFIHLKCSPTSIEKTQDGLPVWRTVVPRPI